MATIISAKEASKLVDALEQLQKDAIIKDVNELIKEEARLKKNKALLFEPFQYEWTDSTGSIHHPRVPFSKLGWLWEMLEEAGYTVKPAESADVGGRSSGPHYVAISWGN